MADNATALWQRGYTAGLRYAYYVEDRRQISREYKLAESRLGWMENAEQRDG